MGRVVRFEVFIQFCVQLPFTKARLPCPLVMVVEPRSEMQS
jgi:hypothetical protein